jgi:hypothetical protein
MLKGQKRLPGNEYGVEVTVPANSIRYISAYAIGYPTGGTATWKKYISGSFAGYYSENTGGTAISANEVNIEVD